MYVWRKGDVGVLTSLSFRLLLMAASTLDGGGSEVTDELTLIPKGITSGAGGAGGSENGIVRRQ